MGLGCEPRRGFVTLGIPLWHGSCSKHDLDGEPVVLHGVGPSEFIQATCLDKIEHDYLDALAKLQEVLEHAPEGRDVRSSVERALRICVIPKLNHVARAYPPLMVRGILKRCDRATLEFALEHLYQWPIERFWSKAHRSLVGMNLQLPLSASGAGLIPQLPQPTLLLGFSQPLRLQRLTVSPKNS